MTTQKRWGDIVLNSSTLEQIDLLRNWLLQHTDIPGAKTRLKEGYRALFYGPAGTGKSLTAALLGNELGAEVYKIDLTKVVSKYIGETEKNLQMIFDQAENKSWILFFDEADALFGKRTDVKDSHDRYPNQEINFLLEKTEGYEGLVIISSNSKKNIDDGFIRRFQSVIHFPLPTAAERRRIWETGFSENNLVNEKIDLGPLAEAYELSPGSIINVIQNLKNIRQAQTTSIITQDLIANEIQREHTLKKQRQVKNK